MQTFKSSSHNKAQQAWELGDSLLRDVIEPLKQLKMSQDQEALDIQKEGFEMISQLRQKTEEVKTYATNYWHKSKQANQYYDDFEKVKAKEHKDTILQK